MYTHHIKYKKIFTIDSVKASYVQINIKTGCKKQKGYLKITGALTSILSVFMEPQEHIVNFELLFRKLEQSS